MSDGIGNRLIHAWNAFINKDPTNGFYKRDGRSSYTRPDRVSLSVTNERTTLSSLYNKIAMDISTLAIQHARLDENGRYLETIDSKLNYVLTQEPNLDQTPMALFHDIVISLFDEGCVAIVPTETTISPEDTGGYDIESLRVGKILEWFPKSIRVRVYNENTGEKEELILEKKYVAIVENPLYLIMNEPNSTLSRLRNKLSLLDAVDNQSASGKLDIIIQLPYIVKTDAKKKQAEERRKDIEMQLTGSKYGIAYIDGTEKVTQLNRPAENNLMAQVEYLTRTLYDQLGITEGVFNGTADEPTMLNYYNRTADPVTLAIVSEMRRKFLTKTARKQRQTIHYFREPFKLVPVNELANIADKFTRNEILSSNEIRAIIGFKPSKQEGADELRNKNLNPNKQIQLPRNTEGDTENEDKEL